MTAQVEYNQAHAFWDAVMGYGYRENNLRALVVDTLQVVECSSTVCLEYSLSHDK
jgi:hypothetical protein